MDIEITEEKEQIASDAKAIELLNEALKNEAICILFCNYLGLMYCQEYLTFYFEVEEYKQLEDKTERQEKAQKIKSTYFSVSSPKEICISPEFKANITKNLMDAPVDLFDAQQAEVFRTLIHLYRRFVKAPEDEKEKAERMKQASKKSLLFIQKYIARKTGQDVSKLNEEEIEESEDDFSEISTPELAVGFLCFIRSEDKQKLTVDAQKRMQQLALLKKDNKNSNIDITTFTTTYDLSTILQPQQHIELILSDTYLAPLFSEYLKSQFADENLYFWYEIEDYTNIHTAAERKERAENIFETYLKPGAELEVNIEPFLKNYIKRNLPKAPIKLLDTAQQKVFRYMEMDHYPRFIASALYTQFLGAQNNLPKQKSLHPLIEKYIAKRKGKIGANS